MANETTLAKPGNSFYFEVDLPDPALIGANGHVVVGDALGAPDGPSLPLLGVQRGPTGMISKPKPLRGRPRPASRPSRGSRIRVSPPARHEKDGLAGRAASFHGQQREHGDVDLAAGVGLKILRTFPIVARLWQLVFVHVAEDAMVKGIGAGDLGDLQAGKIVDIEVHLFPSAGGQVRIWLM